MRSFFAVLAIPVATAVALAVSALLFGPRGPLVALMLNAFLVSEIAGFSQVYAFPMPRGYFRPRRIERPWIYELLGIKAFKWLMRSRAYRRINPDFRLSGGRSGLAVLMGSMQSAEAAHAIMFVTATVFAGAALVGRWFDLAGWLMLFNVLFNAYPVMLQRYNRMRLEPLLKASSETR
jgi:hypothetical protein